MSRTEEILTWLKEAAEEDANLDPEEVYDAFIEVIGQGPRLSLEEEIKANEEMLGVIENQSEYWYRRTIELKERNNQLRGDIEEVKEASKKS